MLFQLQVNGEGGKVVLCGFNKDIREAFAISRLDSNTFEVVDTVDDAIAKLQEGGEE